MDSKYRPGGGGKGAHVYVLDTGIRVTHSEFQGRATSAIHLSSGRLRECNGRRSECAQDRNGHGTHCAGTVGGRTYGVAKEARIYAVKVLGDDSSGSSAGIRMGMDWVVRQ